VTKVALAACGLVIALLGAEVGLAVFRPWDHHVALSLSGSHPSSTLVTPSAAGTCPDVAVRRLEQPQTIPRSGWIHASDGVNVRATPSSSATRLVTLPTGTQVSIQEEQGKPDGVWYRIRLSDGRAGWLSGHYTTTYPISPASTGSLKIWLPAGYQFQSAASGEAEAHYKNGPQTLLYVESGSSTQAPAEPVVPSGLPRRSTWTVVSTEQTLVGDLPATDRVFSIRLRGSGCPAVVHQVRIATTGHYYDFIFLLDAPSSSVVAQLLDSATVQ
jgi:hypothetical protein